MAQRKLSEHRRPGGRRYTGDLRRRTGRPACGSLATRAAVVLAAAFALLVFAATPAPARADAGAVVSPLVLDLTLGLSDQYGYTPAYTRNVPAFDAEGRAYIRSRTSNEDATSYVHTLVGGAWVRLDFLAALRAAYPKFESTVGAGGLRNERIVFDRQDRAYNPVTIRQRDGQIRNALLVSFDHCRTWSVCKLPSGTFTIEHWTGHNEIDGPPFLAIWRKSHDPDMPRSQINELFVTQPRFEGGRFVVPSPVPVTDMCLGLGKDSGGSSFAATRGGKTWFVWSEAAPKGVAGTSHYVATYDQATGTVSEPLKLATTPSRSDPHNKPGICLDTAGNLHVIAGGHGTPALYTRSLAPLSADAGWTEPVPVLSTGWASKTDPAVQTGRQTYPSFVCDSHDTLHLITRQWRRGVDAYHAGSSYGALVHQSCPAGGAWSEPTPIIIAADPGYSVYFQKLALDAHDRLFLSASYQGGPELRSERSLTAALVILGRDRLRPGKYRRRLLLVSEDGGTSWRFATDADLEPPAETGLRAPGSRAAKGPWDGRASVEATALTWRWLNPSPLGNQLTGMAFVKRTGWAVGTHGTLRRSTDGGAHWSAQRSGTIADLYGVSAAGGKAWAVGSGGTILHTSNAGATWTLQTSGIQDTLYGVCALSASDVWVVGAQGALLHSDDGGRTWTSLKSPTSEMLFGVDFAGRRHGLVCGASGVIYETRNRGGSWKRRKTMTTSPLFSVDMGSKGRAMVAGGDGILLVSRNGGVSWQKADLGTKRNLRAVRLGVKQRAWALGPHTVYSTKDLGKRWTAAALPVAGPCGALAAVTKKVLCAGGAGGGACRSGDAGTTWCRIGNGHQKALRAAAVAGDSVWLVGDGGALIRRRGPRGGWSAAKIARGADLAGLARVGSRGWAVGENGVVERTTNGGKGWKRLPPPAYQDLNAAAALSTERIVVVGGFGTLATSADGGTTWQQHWVTVDDLHCLAFADALHGWAGGGAAFGESRALVAKTDDGGDTWRCLDLPAWGRVRGLSFVNELIGWAAVEEWGADGDRPQGAVYATADGGETWVRQTASAAVLLGVRMAADGSGWAWGEQGAVLQTADAGVTWEARDVGTDSAIYAATAAPGAALWLAGADGAVLAGR